MLKKICFVLGLIGSGLSVAVFTVQLIFKLNNPYSLDVDTMESIGLIIFHLVIALSGFVGCFFVFKKNRLAGILLFMSCVAAADVSVFVRLLGVFPFIPLFLLFISGITMAAYRERVPAAPDPPADKPADTL